MSKSSVEITTTITQQPFRCVVCGYLDGRLVIRRETSDQWQVMRTSDSVHALMQEQMVGQTGR